jgi:putative DNA primase/helicase
MATQGIPKPMPVSCAAPESDPESLPEAVSRLAALHLLEYEKVRESEAHRLDVRVGVLDKAVSDAQKTKQEDGGKAAMFPTVEPWHQPIKANDLLHEIYSTVRRFIICDKETAITATLWCAFTWLVDSVEIAPIAVITAPEKRCGKSLLLNLIGKMACRPLVASNIGVAAVFRVIEAHSPTLLIDEADSFFNDNEELRGVINSGHTRQSAYVIRCVGEDHEPRKFSTWGAKAICGIGHLAETLMDRSVILELRRKLPNESIQRLRHAETGLFERLSSKLARFAQDAAPDIKRARPSLPEELNDRAQDNWEPLLAIADYAGGDWPQLARHTALKLSGAEKEAVSIPAELLADIQQIFEIKRSDKISTADLITTLCDDDEGAWATYNRGKPITPRQVAHKLAGYGISSKTIRIDYGTAKGFEKSQFFDAFTRYLSHPAENAHFAVTTSQTNKHGAFSVTDKENVTATEKQKVTPEPLQTLDCYLVTDRTGVSSRGMAEVEI